jgi:hypothetical protein
LGVKQINLGRNGMSKNRNTKNYASREIYWKKIGKGKKNSKIFA